MHEDAVVAAVVVVHGVREVGWGADVEDGEGGQSIHGLGEGFGAEAVGEGGYATEPGGCGEGGEDLEGLISARRLLEVIAGVMGWRRNEEQREWEMGDESLEELTP